MGTSLKGKNLLPEGANSFLYEQFHVVWKYFYHIRGPHLDVTIFISHVRNCVMGTTPMYTVVNPPLCGDNLHIQVLLCSTRF